MRRLLPLSTFLLGIVLLAGCASTKEAAQHPLVGEWEYSVDTPQGVFGGTVTLMEADGVLSGFLTSEGLDGELPLQDVAFEDNALTFSFDSGQFGMMNVALNVDGTDFDGALEVSGFGEMPMKGSKKMADDM